MSNEIFSLYEMNVEKEKQKMDEAKELADKIQKNWLTKLRIQKLKTNNTNKS